MIRNARIPALFAALLISSVAASAQESTASANTSSASQTAVAGNGVLTVNTAAPSPITSNTADVRTHTNQAWGAASPIGPAGNAPCQLQGTVITGQVASAGGGLSIGGSKDQDCRFANLISTVRNIEAARAMIIVDLGGGKRGELPQDPDLYVVLKALGCNIEDVANAYEQTTRPCVEPVKYSERVQRQRTAAGQLPEIVGTDPVAVAERNRQARIAASRQ